MVGKSRSGPALMVTMSGSSSRTTPPGLVRLWNPEATAGTLVAKPEYSQTRPSSSVSTPGSKGKGSPDLVPQMWPSLNFTWPWNWYCPAGVSHTATAITPRKSKA